jgi:hypothetical protein
MIYIEYFSRRPGVELAEFHAGVAKGSEWGDDYAEDRLILLVGRTWRLGPEPGYFMVWHSPNAGFERIDAWDRILRSGEADQFEGSFLAVARVDFAGCYEALFEPTRARDGAYYVEFFHSRDAMPEVRSFYEKRARRHEDFRLNLLAYRMGRLGPEPGGLAVWTLPDFAALGRIVRELDDVSSPVELVRAGTYADIGKEIL